MPPTATRGQIIFGDLIGRTDMLELACRRCDRRGRYRLAHLVHDRGAGGSVSAWMDEVAADCPRRAPGTRLTELCGAHCPTLAAALAT